ncbi:hypothetical protein PK35_12305 [Tamlana nanhaiensis]|uniref:Flavinylation-associated cytochrome domain-containing protein n=1 Tax=Neotamlana nanhaiensis TaxID=1382798 RepID=A0A0D7VYR3_9FLAO|nr:DUF4405 domain-containing protein [Tamlana nanhaiensis]KJD31924.1 hypothetical protein PK35_12305 [Tamlana nanhaiensis]
MNRRLLGNILIISIIILSFSGVFMYLKPYSKNMASVHTFFGLAFILLIVFHIINNKKPLFNYISGKNKSVFKKLQAPFIFGAIIIVAIGLFLNLPGLRKVYNFGNAFRNSQIGKFEETFDYDIIKLENAIGDISIDVEIKRGESFKYPLLAIWAEDSLGNYIETLYVSKVIATSNYSKEKEPEIIRRPEALPYWSHKRGIKASDGLFVPLGDAPDLDAVSGATPTSNFIVKSKASIRDYGNVRVLMEINQSFDWNEYYSQNRFPDDKVYSGNGYVGQPSLVYAASIDATSLTGEANYKIMEVIGHGHHSGQNGQLYPDVSNITSAKHIAERVILTVK